MDGYSFIVTLFIRDFIKKLFPNAHTAKKKSLELIQKSGFKIYAGKQCPQIL